MYAFLADLFIFHDTMGIVDMIGASIILLTTIGVSIYKIKSEKSVMQTKASLEKWI